jgi:dihydroflavonol-4-reductase
MKVFITGATGFVGTNLVKRLSQTEHTLCCLMRKNTPASEQLKKLGATLVLGDVTNKASLLHGMEGCDWVFHLAGLYSFWAPDPDIFKVVNVDGTRNVMECALDTRVSKVVHVSTAGIFGKPDECPFTEESKVGPIRYSEYFKTKYEGDQIVWDLHKSRGLPVVVVYPTAVLGADDPKATGQYINNLIHRRMPATVFNNSYFTFVHVKDVAEVIVRAAEKAGNIGEKYLAGNQQMTFGEINQMVSEISGVPLPWMRLPNSLTMLNAALLTGLANVLKKEPLWGMSTSQMKTMQAGVRADGSKVERELGISYTPVRVALEEAIGSFRR